MLAFPPSFESLAPVYLASCAEQVWVCVTRNIRIDQIGSAMNYWLWEDI